MGFIITDDKNKLWAYGDTETQSGIISFPEICKYLMECLHPEIFTITFLTDREVIRQVSLLEYMKG